MPTKVFIVEDEMIVALDVRSRLEHLGYQVVGTAYNGETALVQIGELLPDVVLMDVSLQGSMDGVEVGARVREQLNIPVVYLTAYSNEELIKRIQITEPFAYVLKPFEEVEVHAALTIATTRHKLERSLVEQKQLLTATLDTIDDGVIVTGEDGTVRFMNPAAERLTGWSLGEAACHPLHDVYRLTDEGTLTARDGTTHRIRSRSNLMKDVAGNWLGFVHSFADVSEREASRRALHEREIEYRILMEQAADAITLFDENGRVLAVNSKTCELGGYTREELLGMSVQDFVDQDELRNDPMMFVALRSGKSIIKERKLRRKDGTYIHVEIHAKALSDGRMQGILRDITKRRATEQKFKEAVRSEVVDKLLQKLRVFAHGESAAMNLNRLSLFSDNPEALYAVPGETTVDAPADRFRSAAEEFVAVIAPELLIVSSLLAIIEEDPVFGTASQRLMGISAKLQGAVQTLQADLPSLLVTITSGTLPSSKSDLTARLRGLGVSVEAIRSTLHDVSQALQTELTCDVDEILKITINRFQSSTPLITVAYEGEVEHGRVVMKGADLSEVIGTLIQNAIEALSSTPTIEEKMVIVRVRSINGKVHIDVEDNGPGIPEEHREQIFDGTFSTKGQGRGFGLAYALRCLQGCGGSIRLDPYVSQGTRFIVELVRV
jgi:PAS domain S-box-containing protein